MLELFAPYVLLLVRYELPYDFCWICSDLCLSSGNEDPSPYLFKLELPAILPPTSYLLASSVTLYYR